MKSIKTIILVLIGSLGVSGAFAQSSRPPLSLNLNYSIAQPLGSLSDYAKNTSFRGWQIGLQYALNDRLALGLKTGFSDFYERVPRAVYPGKGEDVSAMQTHTLQTIPILATVQYTLASPEARVMPYAGLGVGTANMNYEKYWGEFVEKENKWAFQVSPELGVNVPFGKYSPVMLNANVQYNYAPFKVNEISNFNSIQANIGVKFHIQ
ncbi:outer membrane beta-barrel protein [Chitinophaga sp. GCM10012297]|uniref:Porin family protein n=1 Tax=Chitinophaga chungangae TaxID=2821488 RepID=A0ABS3Y953_9BACT|nr:outer membrane beta-barrel protein [Chitinophaga chungangae]MBO9151203.1 porin family protein [Chitinophaga chungangae]